jgi:carboxylate-amine ligase
VDAEGPASRGLSTADLPTRFAQTPDFTLGVEEELVLVDPADGSLVDRPARLEKAMAASGGELQTELFQPVVETVTPIAADASEAAEHMHRLRAWVVEAARDHGLAVAASGTHPFARWETESTSPEPRYEKLVDDVQLPMVSDLVFGQHVHVSVGSREEAIRVTNEMRAFLPLVLALSANAPFWRGRDTGLQSARVNVSAGMPRSGLPPVFEHWASFAAHVGRLQRAGAIEDVTELWWDVRPRPGLGTVEVRIADLPTELDVSASLAAFTHALVVHLARRARREDAAPIEIPTGVATENRWRALRYGLEAELLQARGGSLRTRSVGQTFARLVGAMAPTIRRLGIEDDVARLRRRVEHRRSGAERQRQVFAAEGDMQAVVGDLAARTPP